jgi:hypothetical protein
MAGARPKNLGEWYQKKFLFRLLKNEIFFCLENHNNFSKEYYDLFKVLSLDGKVGYTVVRQKNKDYWVMEI